MLVESFRDHSPGGLGCVEGIHYLEKCKAHPDSPNSSEEGLLPWMWSLFNRKLQQIKWSESPLDTKSQSTWVLMTRKEQAQGLWSLSRLQILLLQRFPPGCKSELMLKKIYFLCKINSEVKWRNIQRNLN